MTFLPDFTQRSAKTLEHLGDAAVDAQRYDEAISHYTATLLLNLPSPDGILAKRSKAYLAWQKALDDANEVPHFYIVQVNLTHASLQGDYA